jgi:hypothetical protein
MPPRAYKGHILLGKTVDNLPFPIQSKGLLLNVCTLSNGPGFARDLYGVAP